MRLDELYDERDRLRTENARMRSALAAIADYFEVSLGFREGDREYQAVIFARDALKIDT